MYSRSGGLPPLGICATLATVSLSANWIDFISTCRMLSTKSCCIGPIDNIASENPQSIRSFFTVRFAQAPFEPMAPREAASLTSSHG